MIYDKESPDLLHDKQQYISCHVTICPSAIAANAPLVAEISLTPTSWSWTPVLSPPRNASPHVVTRPSSPTAANALRVAEICRTFLLWITSLVISGLKMQSEPWWYFSPTYVSCVWVEMQVPKTHRKSKKLAELQSTPPKVQKEFADLTKIQLRSKKN